jgi:short-subunit dehydrogenase
MASSTEHAPRPVAVITGASAGIGRVFAQRLAARGHDLLLVARDGVRLQQVADELSLQYGINAESMPADLARDEGMRSVANRISQLERIDYLVNNAGFGSKGRLVNRPVAEQATMLELHVVAPMLLTRAALPGMVAQKNGTIINVSSVAGFTHAVGNVNYCATKAYLRVFSEGLALELIGTGVHVQALCPGFTRTEFHDRAAIDMKSTPGFLWLDAARVVDDSLAQAARGGSTVCVPGYWYKAIVLLVRYLPQWLIKAIRTPLMKSRA